MENNKYKSAAYKVLSNAGSAMHYREITQAALDAGLLETVGATPEASLNAQLSVDIKQKGSASPFIRTKPGYFTINKSVKIPVVKSKIEEKEDEETEKIVIEGSYTGKGGEHLVCSELLFRGFNASIMSVDVGMDIIATKDNQLFSIQVKTANLNRFDTYVFDVRKVSFERHNSGNIYYVFVLHGQVNNFLIVPLLEMEKKVHEKAILEVGHGNRYRVNIKFRDGTIYLGTKAHDMNYYLNNWSLIK